MTIAQKEKVFCGGVVGLRIDSLNHMTSDFDESYHEEIGYGCEHLCHFICKGCVPNLLGGIFIATRTPTSFVRCNS